MPDPRSHDPHPPHGISHAAASPCPYAVPWLVTRDLAPRYSLRNIGDERLSGVHLYLRGDGRLIWSTPRFVLPGDSVAFSMHASEPARSSVVCVRWFRPSGEEFLWRVSF